MSVVLKIVGLADGRPTDNDGRYLQEFDHEFGGGRGLLKTTHNPDEAKVFESAAAALTFWQRISTERPLRPDGKPNRPLTAYSIEVVTSTLVLGRYGAIQ